jgi:DNA-directed RNA polymerase subunit L
MENKTDTILVATTADFRVLNLTTNEYTEQEKKMFPPFIPPTGKGEYYIDLVRLKPKLSEEIPGNKIKLTCQLKRATAKEDSMYNVVGTCSYGCTPNDEKMAEQVEIRKQKWSDEGKTKAEIDVEAKNWLLLEGMRYIIANSFDFIVETVGVYENVDIVMKACDILADKFIGFNEMMERDEVEIKKSENTLENCYDVILKNEDYTMGNIFNTVIYRTFYTDLNVVNYVGFKKMHPHDSDSILRISITDDTKSKTYIKSILKAVCDEVVQKSSNIKGLFTGKR